MEDLRKMRAANGNALPFAAGAKNPIFGNAGAYVPNKSQQGGIFLQQPAHAGPFAADGVLGNLSQNFNAMNINTAFAAQGRPGPHLPGRPADLGAVALANGMAPQGFVVGNQVIWTGAPHGQAGVSPNAHMFPAQLNPNFYPGNWQQFVDHSPQAPSFPNSRVPSSEVPSLVTPRRDSDSTNDHEVPGTPFTHFTGNTYGGVTILDHSPASVLNWTPSPGSGYDNGKGVTTHTIPVEFQQLLQMEPAIPRAVPAPNSPTKPLDRALQNPNGITNVYIRGLQPDTTDEMLHLWASRFGDIISSKSIIDHTNGKCKGYGFVKYHSYKDAEKCIRGFHYMGYESSFARESFYSVLKKLSDDKNTNLYVSNLPKDMNEHELSSVFGPHKVCSSRILRNPDGSGRGVGFARFESRDVCEEVIRDFNNAPVSKPPGEEHLIQIRYADTKDQKALKQQTTAARNFRTAEYESVTSGHVPMMDPSRTASVSPNGMGNGEFEAYLARSDMARASSFSPMAARWRPAAEATNFPTGASICSERTIVEANEPAAKQSESVEVTTEAAASVEDTPAAANVTSEA